MNSNKIHKGFSLVELLIAMTIGLILISGMIAVFHGNKRSSDLNNAMANMQENARFALENIARDARLAGFQGCADVNTSAATIRASGAPAEKNIYSTVSTGFKVISATEFTPSKPSSYAVPTNPAPVVGTHAIMMQYGAKKRYLLNANMTSKNSDIDVLHEGDAFAVNELVIIANCNFADLFKVSEATVTADVVTLEHAAASNSNSGSLTDPYLAMDTEVMRFCFLISTTLATQVKRTMITSLSLHFIDIACPIHRHPNN